MLAERDMTCLAERWPGHELHPDSNGVAVILPNYRLPNEFSPNVVEMLLRLPFGFPDSQPDMFWVFPHVTIAGRTPEAATVVEQLLGRAWQRFSRHLPPGVWRPGIDDLQSYLALIATMLEREARRYRQAAA
jgi:hypothetical protein